MAEDEAVKAAAARHAGYIASLEFEREGYIRRGLDDRAKQVDEALKAAKKRAAPAEKSEEAAPVVVDEKRDAVESKPRQNRS